jgi:hypothetical protein
MRRISGIIAMLVTLAAGLAGGLWLSATLLSAARAPGTLHAGSWKIWPRAGAPDADPYARALFAMRGEVPLSPAEGLALYADHDAQGRVLLGACAYVLSGRMPQARAWTLAAYAPDGSLQANPAQRVVLTSAETVGGSEGGVQVAREPRPGNWLPLGTSGAFVMVLRLYDTPLAAVSAAIDGARLPVIERLECSP